MSVYITDSQEIGVVFKYPDLNDPILEELRKLAKIQLPERTNSIQKAKIIIGYVHGLFKHDSDNKPSVFEPLTIIKEAQRGKSFRCVEYSLLATALLWAYQIPARMIGLKTSDVETREYGAGHIVLEFWSNKLNKWVMSDVQAGVIPTYDGKPLSVLEVRNLLYENNKPSYTLVVGSKFIKDKMFASEADYSKWIEEYLYFMDTAKEVSFAAVDRSKQLIVMLVPLHIKSPKIFQGVFEMNAIYTHSILDFYPKYLG